MIPQTHPAVTLPGRYVPEPVRAATWRERWIGPLESGGLYIVALAVLGTFDAGLIGFIVSRLFFR